MTSTAFLSKQFPAACYPRTHFSCDENPNYYRSSNRLNARINKAIELRTDHRGLHKHCSTASRNRALRAKPNHEFHRSDYPSYAEEVVEVAEALPGSDYSFLDDPFIPEKSGGVTAPKGSLWGAIALITGTTVGAGILALPASTSPAGFTPSISVMLVCWAFLVIEALLLMEVNVALLNNRKENGSSSKHSEVLSLKTMAQETLGPSGGTAVTLIYLFLSYTLMVAYITKTAEILSFSDNLPDWSGGALFTVVLGMLLYLGDTRTIDLTNQILTTGLLSLFFVIIFGGLSIAELSQLEFSDWTQVPYVIPIVFLSLVYHDLIPVLCSYLNGDVKTLRKALIFGSMIPLSMFMSWTGVALSITETSAGADPIQTFMQLDSGGSMSLVIKVFSLLAIATSFIGSVIGISEFFLEQFGPKLSSAFQALKTISISESKQPKSSIDDTQLISEEGSEALRPVSFFVVLIPPLLISMANPDSFLTAADLAGSYGMTTLYGVFPPLMYWKLQEASSTKQNEKESDKTKDIIQPFVHMMNYFSPKALSLATVGLCACGIIFQQALLDFSQAFPTRTSEVILATKTVDSSITQELDGSDRSDLPSSPPLSILS